MTDPANLKPLVVRMNSFGVKLVLVDVVHGRRLLLNDSTRHGSQALDAGAQPEPLDYYHREGPLADVFAARNAIDPGGAVGIIGLGVGAMAAYAERGQRFTFFEIDPAVAEIASDSRYFGFLSSCRGQCETRVGDGLELLNDTTPGQFGLLILDAFSADTVPEHLLTSAAIDVYASRLAEGGWLLFHTSNVHIELAPIVAGLLNAARLHGLARDDLAISDEERARGKLPSQYIIAARQAADLGSLTTNPAWHALPGIQ